MKKTVFILLTFFLFFNLKAQNRYTYPLKISDDSRALTDQNGRHFFWCGEAAWSLIAQLNRAEAAYYLDDRMQKGFTVLLVNLIEHKFATHAPANYYNERPFSGKPFITPNERYFAYADQIIRDADNRGIVILLCPLYLGWKYGDEGWGAEVKMAALPDLYKWGQYVGKRYRDFDNIIWCIGGDADPSIQKQKVLTFVNGLREADSRHLITAHNIPEEFAATPWEGMNWLSINNLYSYSQSLYTLCKKAYEKKPVMPYFLIESAYENEHNSTPRRLRSEIYWPMLCGGMGFLGGNCPIWHFSSDSTFCTWADWKTQLDLPGSMSIYYLQKLFRLNQWYRLQPDFEHKILTDGFNEWGSEDYVTAARTSDGSTLIAYLPSSSEVTINLEEISGSRVQCWWYEPGNGKTTQAGIFPTQGLKKLHPPGEGDWVLVVKDVSKEFVTP